jgi:hypothetical protein
MVRLKILTGWYPELRSFPSSPSILPSAGSLEGLLAKVQF